MKLSDVLFRELVSHGHIQSQPNGNIQITNNNFVLPQLILSQQLFFTSKDTFTKYLYPNWYIHHICTPRDTFTKYFLHKLIHSPHVYLNWYIQVYTYLLTSIDTITTSLFTSTDTYIKYYYPKPPKQMNPTTIPSKIKLWRHHSIFILEFLYKT